MIGQKTLEEKKLIRKVRKLYYIVVKEFLDGDFDKLLRVLEQGQDIINLYQGNLPETIKKQQNMGLYMIASTHAFQGNLALSFKYAKELLRFAQLNNDNTGRAGGLIVQGLCYGLSGDFNKAIVYLDRAIRLSEENLDNPNDFRMVAYQCRIASTYSIRKGDRENAKKYFKRLEEIWELKPRDFHINSNYLLLKACLLKLSMRSRDRVMAEEIFRALLEDARCPFMAKLAALHELCDFFLIELKISNDITIISEIKPLIEKLIDMAKYSGIHYFLIEAYILHGKLSLITFDLESSKRYFTLANNMAERYGYIGLANEITNLNESMMEKKDTWEQMEKTNVPLSERMELARLEDHLNGKFRRLMMKMERVDEPPPKKEVF